MTLREMLEFRRAVRDFDPNQPIDAAVVRECLEEAQLAPTSSNMQLWEAYHIVDPKKYPGFVEACMGQQAARTAQQFVVFAVRPDWHREHAELNYHFNVDNINKHSPEDRKASRIKVIEQYYRKLMPFANGRFFGLLGALRTVLAWAVGLTRPIVREMLESHVYASHHKSCALVIQTFMIAMAEKKYDTCALGGYDSRRVKKILNLPGDAEVTMVIACGIRQDIRGERYRVPFEKQYHQI